MPQALHASVESGGLRWVARTPHPHVRGCPGCQDEESCFRCNVRTADRCTAGACADCCEPSFCGHPQMGSTRQPIAVVRSDG